MVRDAWCVMRAAGAGGPEGQLTGLVRGENDAIESFEEISRAASATMQHKFDQTRILSLGKLEF